MNKRIIAIVAAFVFMLGLIGSNSLALAATNTTTASTTKATPKKTTSPKKTKAPKKTAAPKKTKAPKKSTKPSTTKAPAKAETLPFSTSFELKKNFEKKYFSGIADGKVTISISDAKLTGIKSGKLTVKVYYRSANNKKWLCPKDCKKTFSISADKNEYTVNFTIPKDKDFYVRLEKKSQKNVSFAGTLGVDNK